MEAKLTGAAPLTAEPIVFFSRPLLRQELQAADTLLAVREALGFIYNVDGELVRGTEDDDGTIKANPTPKPNPNPNPYPFADSIPGWVWLLACHQVWRLCLSLGQALALTRDQGTTAATK